MDNVGQSGGKQCKGIWWWMMRQEKGGDGHNTRLLGSGQHNKRGDDNVVASVAVHLE